MRVAVKDGKLVEQNRYLINEEEPYWCNCDRALYIGDTVYAISGMPYFASFDMGSGELLYKESFADYFENLYREHFELGDTDWESMTAEEPVVYNGGEAVMTSPAYKPSEEPETAVAYTTPEPDTVPIDGEDNLAPDAVPETEPPMTETTSR